MNHHADAGQLIPNLPADASVEVACLIEGDGVNPTRFGALPRQMAHLCARNLAMFDSGAKTAIHPAKEAAIHALLLVPLSAAVCSPSQIRDMTLELFAAEKAHLPDYR